MRAALLILLLLSGFALGAQSKPADVDITMIIYPTYEKISLKIKSQSAAMIDFKLQILNSDKKVVKRIELPKSGHMLESSIPISDLLAGEYTCVIYQGKSELFRNTFFKDALQMATVAERHLLPAEFNR